MKKSPNSVWHLRKTPSDFPGYTVAELEEAEMFNHTYFQVYCHGSGYYNGLAFESLDEAKEFAESLRNKDGYRKIVIRKTERKYVCHLPLNK